LTLNINKRNNYELNVILWLFGLWLLINHQIQQRWWCKEKWWNDERIRNILWI